MVVYRRPLRTLLVNPNTSTKWPGASRYAVYMPLFSALLGVLEVVLGALLLSKTYHFGERGIECLQVDDEGKIIGLETTLFPPLTIKWYSTEKMNRENTAPFSLDRNAGAMLNVFSCVVFPLCVTIASIYATGSHFWKRGIPGARAAVDGALLMAIWGLVWWGGNLGGIDHKEVVDWWKVCIVSNAVAVPLGEERRKRMSLEEDKEWGTVGGMIW